VISEQFVAKTAGRTGLANVVFEGRAFFTGRHTRKIAKALAAAKHSI